MGDVLVKVIALMGNGVMKVFSIPADLDHDPSRRIPVSISIAHFVWLTTPPKILARLQKRIVPRAILRPGIGVKRVCRLMVIRLLEPINRGSSLQVQLQRNPFAESLRERTSLWIGMLPEFPIPVKRDL